MVSDFKVQKEKSNYTIIGGGRMNFLMFCLRLLDGLPWLMNRKGGLGLCLDNFDFAET
jgi:hypothetical protein